MSPRSLSFARAGVLVLAAAGYLWGLLTDPRLDPEARRREAFLKETLARTSTDGQRDQGLAEAYWSRYPDVAASPAFGRSGPLGALGAREHYLRYGRHEGRVWGL